MAQATTMKFEQLVLELSEDGGSTWARICGLTDATVTRSANIDTVEIPDCDDESLPFSVEKQVRSLDYSVSATGVWAAESHGTLLDWLKSSATKDARIGYLAAASSTPEYETGKALLTNLSHTRTKGQKVSASIELQFDGTPTSTDKA